MKTECGLVLVCGDERKRNADAMQLWEIGIATVKILEVRVGMVVVPFRFRWLATIW